MTIVKRLPLWGKVLLIAALNAALLGGASAWLLRRLLTRDFGSILLGSARERIVAVSHQLGADLAGTEVSGRDALIARYAARYGQTFYLFQNSGAQVAGPAVTLPEAVLRRLREGPRAPGAQIGRGPLVPPMQAPPFLISAHPGYWVGARLAIRAAGQPGVDLGVMLVSSPNLITNGFLFDAGPWLAYLGVVLAITLICWLPLVGGMTRAISGLVATTVKIAAGRLDARVEVMRSDELGVLAEAVNRMTSQLEEHVNGQKRFLRDAAHELRSPLARMQAALGILERRTGPESEQVLQDLREEIELMSALTGDLLTLARADAAPGTPAPRLTSVNLAKTAVRAVATENAGGTAEVRVQIDPALQVMAIEEGLFRGVSNLVRNAIRYAGQDGPITVAANTANGSAVLTIADRGPGIPPEAIGRIFTPFYRLDASRTRQTGGTGLGMSIARTCVEASRGTIECRNTDPGLLVTITLPLA